FLRRRPISALIWLGCLAGTALLFIVVPKAFLPPGDSSVIFGVIIGQEGSSPAQMQTLQARADDVLHEDPNIVTNFSMTGAGQFLSSNQGILFIFIKPPGTRAPIQNVAGQLMGKLGAIPGLFAFLRPYPVLEISTGATN